MSTHLNVTSDERVASEYLLSELDLPITVDDYLIIRNQKQAEAWPRLILRPGALKLIKHLLKHNIPIAVGIYYIQMILYLEIMQRLLREVDALLLNKR